ncbi:MAG: hypothetical protein HY517_04830 [Candidatus Aenigmarchaeota archaeon]|nr:hypothetical protein [Candidatus Aenigmarchaeota archaeon]
MSWPALLKAKDNVKNISLELDSLLKEAHSLNKKDIVNHKETVLAGIDKSIEEIGEQIAGLEKNLEKHRKYFESKSVFLRRHHKML